MRSLYLRFIRPYLEFAVPVWCPFLKGDIDMIGQVQQWATRLISTIRNLSYENRLRKLELTTLKDRRLREDLIQMFKIMNKMDKCDRYNRFKIILNQARGHSFKYFKEITRQPYREHQWTALKQALITGWAVVDQISCHSVPDNTLTSLASTAKTTTTTKILFLVACLIAILKL